MMIHSEQKPRKNKHNLVISRNGVYEMWSFVGQNDTIMANQDKPKSIGTDQERSNSIMAIWGNLEQYGQTRPFKAF